MAQQSRSGATPPVGETPAAQTQEERVVRPVGAGPNDGADQQMVALKRGLRACREAQQTAEEDLDNLLAGARMGALYLDTKLCIRKLTPLISAVTEIQLADLGRPIRQADFTERCPHLVQDVQRVLDTLQPGRRELTGPQGDIWQVDIRPYRTASYAVEGVLITLTEITRCRQLEQSLAEVTDRLERLGQHMAEQELLLRRLVEGPAALKLFVDREKRPTYLSRRAKTWFGTTGEGWTLPTELSDVFELMRDETHLRICQGVPLEDGEGHGAWADVVAEPSRDGEGRLLGVLYTISLEREK